MGRRHPPRGGAGKSLVDPIRLGEVVVVLRGQPAHVFRVHVSLKGAIPAKMSKASPACV